MTTQCPVAQSKHQQNIKKGVIKQDIGKYVNTMKYWVVKNSMNTNQKGGARGVMVIVTGCRHDDMSSNPGRS